MKGHCYGGAAHSWMTEQQTGHRHCWLCGTHKTKREANECVKCVVCGVLKYRHGPLHNFQAPNG